MKAAIISVLALVFAIAATVLAYIFLVPEKKYAKLNKFGKFLHNMLNFKTLIIEKILQALYIFSTAFIILLGFFMLFYVERYGYYYYSYTKWYGGYGIMLMLFGPIVIRLLYEFGMMFILLIKNVIQINNKLKSQNEEGEAVEDIFADTILPIEPKDSAEPEAPAATAAFCSNCGAPIGDGAFCTNCGAKVK